MRTFTLLSTLCVLFLQPVLAQFPNAAGSQTTDKKYVKSNDAVASNLKVCVLCDDAKLTKNCKSYLVDKDGQRVATNFTAAALKKMQGKRTIGEIADSKTEPASNGTTLRYVDQGTAHAYIFAAGTSGINIVETGQYLGTNAIAREVSVTNEDLDKRLKCIECKLDLNNCLLRHPGESDEAKAARGICTRDYLLQSGCVEACKKSPTTTKAIFSLPPSISGPAVLQAP